MGRDVAHQFNDPQIGSKEFFQGFSGILASLDDACERTIKNLVWSPRSNRLRHRMSTRFGWCATNIDLQREILAAQAQQSALIENVSKLEKEVTALKAWDADKQRYELKDLWRGFFAFIPKEGMENGEPAHAICANCYQRGFKSFLQSSGHPVIHDRSWDCHACKAKMKNQSNNMGELIARCRGAPA